MIMYSVIYLNAQEKTQCDLNVYHFLYRELEETSQAMKSIEDDKHRLHSTTSELQSQLEVRSGFN